MHNYDLGCPGQTTQQRKAQPPDGRASSLAKHHKREHDDDLIKYDNNEIRNSSAPLFSSRIDCPLSLAAASLHMQGSYLACILATVGSCGLPLLAVPVTSAACS